MKFRTLITTLLLLVSVAVHAQEPRYIRHKVRWMETLYSIGRKYQVDPKEIAILNNLPTGEIYRGQILLIPDKTKQTNIYLEDTRADTLLTEEAVFPDTDRKEEGASPCLFFERNRDYKPVLSVLLPFEDIPENAGFLEFYQGLLLAVEQMKQTGMQAVVQVYDWDEEGTDALLSSYDLARSQVIIGPVYAPDVGTALAYFRDSATKIVSPLDSKSDVWVSSFSNFLQVQPPLEIQQEAILKYLEPHRSAVWVISEEGEQLIAPGIRGLLDRNVIPYRSFAYDVLKGREVTEQLKELLENYPHNQIIIASQNEAFVSDAIRNLHLLSAYEHIPIELFGLSRWYGFKTLDLTALHELKVVLPLSAYVDYTQEHVKDFVALYRALFHSEPTAFAFQGYDIAYFFLQALYQYGPHFEDCLDNLHLPLLQTRLSFVRKDPGHGFINTGVRMVRYLPDYSIELLP
ncbi:MAG: LysM peptidoglycan-binding domain-containing protein [Bacteroidales bacterium]